MVRLVVSRRETEIALTRHDLDFYGQVAHLRKKKQ